MKFAMKTKRIAAASFLIGLALSISACQSDTAARKAADAGVVQAPPPPAADDLANYCPSVNLRSGTAFYDVYSKVPRKKRSTSDDPDMNGQTSDKGDNSADVVYQASIDRVTRSCSTANGTMTMTIAAAGRVVPGPKGSPGAIDLPVRIAVLRGDQILYSNLGRYPVSIQNADDATQFIYKSPSVSFAAPKSHDTVVYIGFDAGPEKKTSKRKKKR